SASAWLQARPAIGIAVVLSAFATLVLGLALSVRGHPRHPETLRKCVHVAMGLITLTFPWVFSQPWPVWLMAGLALIGMLGLRSRPFASSAASRVLHGVDRDSFGDLLFPISVAVLFSFTHEHLTFYVIAILVLTLADATAALVGLRYGTVRIKTGGAGKSLEGGVAFFVVTFFAVHVPLLLGTSMGRSECLLIACTLALLVSLAELISTRGFDNLVVPLGCFALLQVYGDMTVGQLTYRLAAAIALVGFVAVWRRRTTLDHAALIASALFGYFALMIAGWGSLIPAALLLAVPALIWPRQGGPSYQDVGVVVTDTALPATMLLGYALAPNPLWLVLYGLGLAHHLGCVIVSFAVWDGQASPRHWGIAAAIGASAAVCVAGSYAAWVYLDLADAIQFEIILTVGLGAMLSTLLFAAVLPSLVKTPVVPMRIHLVSNACLLMSGIIVTVCYTAVIR
ncbi:MAG: hypothetical protein AAGC91_11925, partial [Pseudomonadota bacterium]